MKDIFIHSNWEYNTWIIYLVIEYSKIKPVLRGHKEKVAYKTGDLLNEVQFIWNFLWQDKKIVTF